MAEIDIHSPNNGIAYNDAKSKLTDSEDISDRVTPTRAPSAFTEIAQNPEKAAQTRRARKTLKELAQIIGNEWVDYITDEGKTVTIPRNALVLFRFYESAIKKPTAQKIIALQKILGEDVFRIGTDTDPEHKGSTNQLKGELNTLIQAINYRAHTVGLPSAGANPATALDFVKYDEVVDEDDA